MSDLRDLLARGEKFPVIYADPPWPFDTWSDKGKDRSPERHYATMTLDEIKALPVAGIAEDDCVLFLWATTPRLPDALAVIEAWGWIYKTVGFTWVKTTSLATGIGQDGSGLHTGCGYWTRANAEYCLLARRQVGKKTPSQRRDRGVHQVVIAPREEHSRKPDEVARRIERLLPGPYIELFARRPRPGWTVWGDEVPAAVASGRAP